MDIIKIIGIIDIIILQVDKFNNVDLIYKRYINVDITILYPINKIPLIIMLKTKFCFSSLLYTNK